MGIIIAKNDVDEYIMLDTKTQIIHSLPKGTSKFFTYLNKSIYFFDNVRSFFESDITTAVVPFVVSQMGRKKRRTFIEIIDHENNPYKMFNVEMINYKWENNRIDQVEKNSVYFMLLKKNKYAMNDFILLSALEIKKERHLDAP